MIAVAAAVTLGGSVAVFLMILSETFRRVRTRRGGF